MFCRYLFKEEVALSGFFIGLYVVLSKKENKLGIAIALMSLIYFLLVTKILMPLFHPPYNFMYRYQELVNPNEGSYEQIFYTIIAHPLDILKYIFFNPGKIIYLYYLFFPLAFLPFFSRFALLLIIPSIFTNLLASFSDQYTILYQYTGIIIPFIYFTAIVGYQNLPNILKKYRSFLCYTLIVIGLTSTLNSISLGIRNNLPSLHNHYPNQKFIETLLEQIPVNASISTFDYIMLHVTQREEAWLFPNINDAEYILYESTTRNYFSVLIYNQRKELIKKILQQKQYGVIDFDNTTILLKKGYSTEKNSEALKVIAE